MDGDRVERCVEDPAGWWRRLRTCGAAGRRITAAAAVAALVGLTGCGGGEGAPGGDARAAGTARGAPPETNATAAAPSSDHLSAAAATDSSPCPATGRWALCSVFERLERAGLVPDSAHESATEPPLRASGTKVTVRRAAMELYVYPTREARERDERLLDRSRYLAADQPPEPRHKPTLVTSENLLVVLDTRNERQRERITLALTAGPPQPPAP